MFKYLVIDSEKNKLLCNSILVGIGELAEVYEKDTWTPSMALGRILRKVADPDVFEAFEGPAVIKSFQTGERCVLKVLCKNMSGGKRRKFFKEERNIVNMEHGAEYHERKVCKSKTGSVRKKKKS